MRYCATYDVTDMNEISNIYLLGCLVLCRYVTWNENKNSDLSLIETKLGGDHEKHQLKIKTKSAQRLITQFSSSDTSREMLQHHISLSLKQNLLL